MRAQDGFGWVEIVLVVAAVLLISGSGYLFYHNSGRLEQTKPKPPVAQNQEEAINAVPSEVKVIANAGDIDKATQTINELDLDANTAQAQQLETDARVD